MVLLFHLFTEFFKTGLFAVGGGLATLPFLCEIAKKTDWFTMADIADMVAVSESTPGPMGVNMATFTGFKTMGPIGALAAVAGLILPSVVIIILVSKILRRFKDSFIVQSAFTGLRPASMALIASAGLGVLKLAVFGGSFGLSSLDIRAFCIFAAFFAAIRIFKKHPILYIAAAAVCGLVLGL